MSVQLPAWCGVCDASTRRFDLGDRERRCPTCHPFWAFRLANVDAYRVPTSVAEQEQAARWLLYELVGLRALPLAELRRRTELFFEAGWTPADIMHALAFDPVGVPVRLQTAAAVTPEQSGRLVLSLLTAWCDERGRPLRAPSDLDAERHERLRAHQQRVRAARAEAEARAAGPQSPGRLAARQAAAEAAARGRQLRTINEQREYAARVAARAGQQAQQDRADQALRRLEKWRFSVVPEAGGSGQGGQPPAEAQSEPPEPSRFDRDIEMAVPRRIRAADGSTPKKRVRKAATARQLPGDRRAA